MPFQALLTLTGSMTFRAFQADVIAPADGDGAHEVYPLRESKYACISDCARMCRRLDLRMCASVCSGVLWGIVPIL
jgi:hypothetical protein